MIAGIVDQPAQRSPATMRFRSILERLLSDETSDEIFRGHSQFGIPYAMDYRELFWASVSGIECADSDTVLSRSNWFVLLACPVTVQHDEPRSLVVATARQIQ
jgi:hypothetical protein